MNRPVTLASCVVALVVAAAVAVATASRHRRRTLPSPKAAPASSSVEVRVKAVERKGAVQELGTAGDVSHAVAVVCGWEAATADRYEARNDALRSIARRRDLPKDDVAALLAYLREADDALRIERVAALKNDVMNLLRNQDPPVEGLAETLIAMIEGGNSDCEDRSLGCSKAASALQQGRGRPCHIGGDATTHNSSTPNSPTHPHPPVVVDYCIQHLGAMVNELDEAGRKIVRGVFIRAARESKQPYAGTALYSLAEDRRATPAQDGELKRLTLALCKPGVNNVARIAAIQLAGQRGYSEALPALRETLSGARRDAVLDAVCIGSIGLLGNGDDIALISRYSSDSRRAAAVEAAVRRIKGRAGSGESF